MSEHERARPSPSAGEDLMADLAASGGEPDEGGQARHRVIGTPAPAQARTLLPPTRPSGPAEVRELPADPEDLPGAKRAERVVAACFTIAMLAGFGFIACYVIFRVHTINNVLHSNLALGLTMAVAFLAHGRRRRHLGPAADAERGAHRAAPRAAVHAGEQGRVRQDLRGGRGGQPVRQAARSSAGR